MLMSQALSVVPAGQVATARQSDAQLFAALARMAEWRMCAFNAQELSNTAWAFATASQSDVELLAALARMVEWRLCAFNAQELSLKAKFPSDYAGLSIRKP